ncbi:hypothetical protein BaRGS_00009452 [Batillaria attramentaria]|uniref:Uncharacterized protein n=1 Tax=Batillaria attramentaria TaxID=370345 RepID=A0ABD0LIP1_9CAEN
MHGMYESITPSAWTHFSNWDEWERVHHAKLKVKSRLCGSDCSLLARVLILEWAMFSGRITGLQRQKLDSQYGLDHASLAPTHKHGVFDKPCVLASTPTVCLPC